MQFVSISRNFCISRRKVAWFQVVKLRFLFFLSFFCYLADSSINNSCQKQAAWRVSCWHLCVCVALTKKVKKKLFFEENWPQNSLVSSLRRKFREISDRKPLKRWDEFWWNFEQSSPVLLSLKPVLKLEFEKIVTQSQIWQIWRTKSWVKSVNLRRNLVKFLCRALDSKAQESTVWIEHFLSLRFYLKSILGIIEVQKTAVFAIFWALNFANLENGSLQKVQIFKRFRIQCF